MVRSNINIGRGRSCGMDRSTVTMSHVWVPRPMLPICKLRLGFVMKLLVAAWFDWELAASWSMLQLRWCHLCSASSGVALSAPLLPLTIGSLQQYISRGDPIQYVHTYYLVLVLAVANVFWKMITRDLATPRVLRGEHCLRYPQHHGALMAPRSSQKISINEWLLVFEGQNASFHSSDCWSTSPVEYADDEDMSFSMASVYYLLLVGTTTVRYVLQV